MENWFSLNGEPFSSDDGSLSVLCATRGFGLNTVFVSPSRANVNVAVESDRRASTTKLDWLSTFCPFNPKRTPIM